MKKLFLIIAFAGMAWANQGVGGFCEQGNIAVLTSGLPSTNVFQGSFPSCTVSVFTAGTTNLITIFADNINTPLSNPFTANTSGRWLFYSANNQRVDIQLSGGGLPTPWKINDVILNDPNGGVIVPSNFAGIRVVDGVTFTSNAAGINAADANLGATMGEVWIPSGALTATDAQISIRAGHTLRILGSVTIDALNRGPVLLGGTSKIACSGNYGAANLLNVSAQAIPSMVRLTTQDGSLGSMAIEGCRIDANGSTVTNGVIDASGATGGPSYIRENFITGLASGWGVFVQDIQSGALAGTNNVQIINNRISASGTGACVEILHSATNAVTINSIDVLDNNCAPGATSTTSVLIQNTDATPSTLRQINIANLNVTSTPTGQSSVSLNGVQQTTVKGLSCISGTNCLLIPNNANNAVIAVDNVLTYSGNNALNDAANAITVATSAIHYDFQGATNTQAFYRVNSTLSGNNTFTGTNTLSGPLVVTGTDTGTQTISGSKTFSGANTFSNTNSFSNTSTFTGAVNASGATSLKNQSNTRWVDGTSYACSDVGLNAAVTDVIAANANGGTIYVGCPGTNTIAATVNVGSASAHIQLIFLDQSVWNCTINNAANDCWFLFPNSSMEGAAHGANQTQLTISAAASVRSIVKTFSHVTPGVASHVRMRNLEIHNQSLGTIANAVVDLQGNYDSSFSDLTIDKFNGRGLWIHDFTAPAGGNSLAFFNLLVDGQSTAGARPLVIEQNNGATSNGSAFHFFGGDWGHPGAGQFLVELNGHGTTAFGQISFENIYMESNTTDTTTAIIKVADVTQVNFNNIRMVRLSGSSTAPGIAISETAANLTGNIGAKNLLVAGGSACATNAIITNTVPGSGTGTIQAPSCALADYTFISSELGDQSQIGNMWQFPNGSALFGNVSGARTNAVTPNFPVEIYQNANTATGLNFFQNTISSWRVGMGANVGDFCIGQNDAMTTCPFRVSPIGADAQLKIDGNGHSLVATNLTTSNPAGNVVSQSCNTSQRTETAADANLLTCAIPAVAGSYRIRFVLAVSAANAATLGWTATWVDSNGNLVSTANLPVFQLGNATSALTSTLSTASELWGYVDADVNNAGTSIVVKLTFSGTSFTGKASATVERII